MQHLAIDASKAVPRRPLGVECSAFPSVRLPCDARPPGASKNSLRSLRSLWSNSFDEYVVEARVPARFVL
jgi:hypothetical protein